MFLNAPWVVSPIFRAAPPTPCSRAFWKVSNEILPSEASLRASSAVTPISAATICKIGMPASISWFATSICIMSEVATLLMIDPIDCRSVPAIAAASPVSFRVRSRSWPGLIPAATADAAIVAASSNPYAVPRTELRALSMIEPTSDALLPSPDSFASACLIELSRPMPLVSPAANAAPPATPTPTAVRLSAVPIPDEIFDPIDCPVFCASASIPVSSLRTWPCIPCVEMRRLTHAVASSATRDLL